MPVSLLPNQAQTLGATAYLHVFTHASSQDMHFLLEGESYIKYTCFTPTHWLHTVN